MPTEAAIYTEAKLRRFRSSKMVIASFAVRRSLKSACMWGFVFGLYVYAAAIGFMEIAPTAVSRARILGSLTDNVGLKALFGDPHDVYTIGGFVDWRNLSIIILVGAIWGLMTSTRMFRGDEESGRWELFMAGQTTFRKATANALVGLGVSLSLMFVVTSIVIIVVSTRSDIGFTVVQSLIFSATAICGAGVFLAIGACMSQLMPTRGSARTVAATILGLCFLLRAAADLAGSAHWLVYITPFGWAELVRPLSSDKQPMWLLPIAGLIVGVSILAVYLAGRRDLGESIIPDRDTARAHTMLLNTPLGAAVRFTRGITIGWLLVMCVFGLFFGSLAKSAGQAFSSSDLVKKLGADLMHQTQVVGAKVYISFVFFLIMTLIMLFVAAAASRMREDEAEGYVDNLLVRTTDRAAWLWGRIAIIATTSLLAGLAAAGAIWISSESQHTGLDFSSLFLAGINATAPAFLLLGISVFIFGFLPRFTSAILYGFIGWSFLLQLVGSILSLSHWVLDTSALYHITLAPSVEPNWRTVSIYLLVAIFLMIIGVWRFGRRDLVEL